MKKLLILLAASALQAQATDPKPLVEKVVAAAGGADKLLTLFRIEEVFHFGDQPEPPTGKQRSKRTSVIEPPKYWWLGRKEREDEPAKFDVWAWTLGILIDPQSKIDVIPGITDEGVTTFGLCVSGTVEPAMDLHFNTATNRLVRIDWRADFYRFSEWREHDGAGYPAKCIIFKTKTGKPWFFHEITGIERLKELPAGLER